MMSLHRLSRSHSHRSSTSDLSTLEDSSIVDEDYIVDSVDGNQKENRLSGHVFISDSIKRSCVIVLYLSLSTFLIYHTFATTRAQLLLQSGSSFLRGYAKSEQCSVEWKHLSCQAYLKTGSVPPFTSDQWRHFRKTYVDVVGEEQSSLDPSWGDVDENGEILTGYRIPMEVRVSPGKGRGIYTKEFVPKGQKIWDNRYTARFPDECSVRKFLSSLPEQDACSVVMWGYVNDFYGKGMQFQLDLDPAVYFNDGAYSHSDNVMQGFGIGEHGGDSDDALDMILDPEAQYAKRRQPGSYAGYATQDLEPGTELLIDYSKMHIFGLVWFEKLAVRSHGLWGALHLY